MNKDCISWYRSGDPRRAKGMVVLEEGVTPRGPATTGLPITKKRVSIQRGVY